MKWMCYRKSTNPSPAVSVALFTSIFGDTALPVWVFHMIFDDFLYAQVLRTTSQYHNTKFQSEPKCTVNILYIIVLQQKLSLHNAWAAARMPATITLAWCFSRYFLATCCFGQISSILMNYTRHTILRVITIELRYIQNAWHNTMISLARFRDYW